jgi:hypothetical protein
MRSGKQYNYAEDEGPAEDALWCGIYTEFYHLTLLIMF